MKTDVKIFDTRDEKYIEWNELDSLQKEEMTEMFLADCETYESQVKIMDMYIKMQCNTDINTHCLKN